MADIQEKLEKLTAELGGFVQELKSKDPQSSEYNSCRIKVAQTSRAIHDLTKGQTDAGVEHVPSLYWMLTHKLFLEWSLFDFIPAQGSISYEELAAKAEADVDIISQQQHQLQHAPRLCANIALPARLSWVLVAFGELTQIGPDRVAHTEKSRIYIGRDSPTAAETELV